ncbi:MAG: arginine--tRNA ligase [Deltaproteobacteria bacterium]|nr:arginine--tRNA ligase [Deltaproteobacteria bacterium]
MKKRIQEAIAATFPEASPELELTVPGGAKFGDFTTNVALTLAGPLKEKPLTIAEKIKDAIKDPEGLIVSSSLAGPGFLNFTVSPAKWIESLGEVFSSGENFGRSADFKGKKAVIEFVSANPTGPLHIGNARGGPLGDAVASLMTALGYEVTREFYVNDIGGQIDKLGESILAYISGKSGKEDGELGYKGGYVKDLADLARGKFDEAHKLGLFGIEVLTDEVKKDCDDLGIRFDSWIHEKDILESGETKKILDRLKKKKAVIEKEGATWFAPQGEAGEDRESVLERSDGGRPTYFANDIAYHAQKYDRGFDLLVNVWGSNHHGHVSRIKAAMSVLGHDPEKIRTVLYQYVRVKRGEEAVKMSKRGGNFVTAREVLDEVGRDAFRFFLLLRSPEAHLDFDLELAKKQSAENPVYYVQYAHARICSILAKAAEGGIAPPTSFNSGMIPLVSLPEEIGLARKLQDYPEAIRLAAKEFAPHRVAFYLLDLARAFQSYYDKAREDASYRVVGGTSEVTQAKLFLLLCIRQVIRNALGILGISAPEKM